MPLQYSGIVDEHLTVRRTAGLFDISHMGNFSITGPGAADFLSFCLTNNVSALAIGQGQYTLMCNETGGVIDDLYLFRVKPQEYLLVVNASRTQTDWDWLQAQVEQAPTSSGFRLRDDSASFAAVAVQGPRAKDFLAQVVEGGSIAGMLVPGILDLKKNQWGGFVFQGQPLGAARTGYTGEDGFELVAPASRAQALWDCLLEKGADVGLKPAGLGARDTLRTEMGFPLYGHELSQDINPLEAGLGAFVALDQGRFVGSEALRAQKEKGLTRRSAALRMSGKSPPPRAGYPVFSMTNDQDPVGKLTSGARSPSLETGIGMALLAKDHRAIGTELRIGIRDRLYPATVVSKPFYKRATPEEKTARCRVKQPNVSAPPTPNR